MSVVASNTNSPRSVPRQLNTRALNKPRDFVSTVALPSMLLVVGKNRTTPSFRRFSIGMAEGAVVASSSNSSL